MTKKNREEVEALESALRERDDEIDKLSYKIVDLEETIFDLRGQITAAQEKATIAKDDLAATEGILERLLQGTPENALTNLAQPIRARKISLLVERMRRRQ